MTQIIFSALHSFKPSLAPTMITDLKAEGGRTITNKMGPAPPFYLGK